MQSFAIVAVLTLSLTAYATAEELSPAALRQEIHAALRAESTTSGAQRDDAIRRLTELYGIVESHEKLTDTSRRQLMTQVRARLKRVEAMLANSLAQSPDPQAQQADASKTPPRPQAILAQVQGIPPAGGAPAGAPRQNTPAGTAAGAGGAGASPFAARTVANANQLIELIQNTIAPKSWDVRGGAGTIRYFAPAQVLVIRQNGGIHDEVSNAISQMRANRGRP